jgi:hypothetical protein
VQQLLVLGTSAGAATGANLDLSFPPPEILLALGIAPGEAGTSLALTVQQNLELQPAHGVATIVRAGIAVPPVPPGYVAPASPELPFLGLARRGE